MRSSRRCSTSGFYDNASTASKKAKELWTLVELKPGDEVIANRGTSEILALGTVTESGYSWDESRADYRHTVGVSWDTSVARSIDPHQEMGNDNRLTRERRGVSEDLRERVDQLGSHSASVRRDRGSPGTSGPGHSLRSTRNREDLRSATERLSGSWTAARPMVTALRNSKRGSLPSVARRVLASRHGSWLPTRANGIGASFAREGTVSYRLGRLKRNYPDLRAGDLVIGYESTPTKRVVALARVVSEYDPDGDPEEAFILEYVADVADGPTWDELTSDQALKESEPIRFRCQGTLFRLTTAEAQVLLAALGARDGSIRQHVTAIQRLLTRTTFHPSYTYEDFIEGYRPKETTSGGLELGLVDGVFKDVCAAAAANPSARHVVIIDEINRGNIPKVFGELITLLEKDKRGLTVRLPQSGDEFAVPPNVYLIGTMNTADRSIHLLDTALRRRFGFVEMMPTRELIAGETVGYLALDVFLDQLNARVRELAGRERQIGHAVFYYDGGVVQSPDAFAAIFRHEILPLLQEYLYEDYSQLAELLGDISHRPRQSAPSFGDRRRRGVVRSSRRPVRRSTQRHDRAVLASSLPSTPQPASNRLLRTSEIWPLQRLLRSSEN